MHSAKQSCPQHSSASRLPHRRNDSRTRINTCLSVQWAKRSISSSTATQADETHRRAQPQSRPVHAVGKAKHLQQHSGKGGLPHRHHRRATGVRQVDGCGGAGAGRGRAGALPFSHTNVVLTWTLQACGKPTGAAASTRDADGQVRLDTFACGWCRVAGPRPCGTSAVAPALAYDDDAHMRSHPRDV